MLFCIHANEMHCSFEWLAFQHYIQIQCENCSRLVQSLSPPTEPGSVCIVFEPCQITHNIEKMCLHANWKQCTRRTRSTSANNNASQSDLCADNRVREYFLLVYHLTITSCELLTLIQQIHQTLCMLAC